MFEPIRGAPSEGFYRQVYQVAFSGEVRKWNCLEESGGAPLKILSWREISPCFDFCNSI